MRLIDADVLKEKAYPFPCAICVEYAVTLRAINDTPTIDAIPALHGYWIVIRDKWGNALGVKCSECGRRVKNGGENFCPKCGLKMDGGVEG